MNSLVAAKAGTVERVPDDLSGTLRWLCRFGKPRLFRHGGDWSCAIEMNTNTTGSEFTIRSGFGHQTPDAAVDVAIANMLTALAAVNGARHD